MPTIVRERQYVYLRLAIEEDGSYGGGNGGMDCSYTVYDPTGMLEGNLAISCKDIKLGDLLQNLRVVHTQPSVFDRPVVNQSAAAPTPSTQVLALPSPEKASSNQPSSPSYRPSASASIVGRRPADVAADVSAGDLIADLASAHGVVDPFTVSLGSLLDDLLRPQK